MSNWSILQQEVSLWALHNFGVQGAWQPMLGLTEEIGEFIAARVVYGQQLAAGIGGILHHGPSVAALEDAIADQCIYALNLAQICGIHFEKNVSSELAEPLTDAELFGAIALASRAVLKHAQGIRGYGDAKRSVEVSVALALWFRWASHQTKEFDLRPIMWSTSSVWEEVKRRDWKKNPVDANVAASQEQIATAPQEQATTASQEQK